MQQYIAFVQFIARRLMSICKRPPGEYILTARVFISNHIPIFSYEVNRYQLHEYFGPKIVKKYCELMELWLLEISDIATLHLS